MPPRATLPARRCTPSTRGEYTKISNIGRGSGRSGIALGSSFNATHGGGLPAPSASLEPVRAQRREHEVQQAAQDAVLVERGDRVELGADLVGQLFDRIAVAVPVAHRSRDPGIEAGDEQLDEPARDLACAGQRVLDVGLAERRPGLAQVAAVRAQQRDLAPREPGGEHEAVEAVVFGAAVDHREEGLFEEPRARRGR